MLLFWHLRLLVVASFCTVPLRFGAAVHVLFCSCFFFHPLECLFCDRGVDFREINANVGEKS